MPAKTVLAVDDEHAILEPIKAYLEKQGYHVLTAQCGKDALSLFEQADIIILDLMLPDISGETVCREIRKISQIPIIMLTAKVAEDSQIDGLSIGADDYILKPFSLKVLMAKIEAVLRRLPESEPPELFADKQLTATERKIVNALSKRPSRTFTREELLIIAFDDKFDSYDRVVDTHIKNLRKKIGAKFIKTIHGVGYKWGRTV